MNELRKVVLIRDIISESKRDIHNISFYYPVDLLLEIMSDIMSLETDNKEFDDFIRDNPVQKIKSIVEKSTSPKPDDYRFDETHYRDYIHEALKIEAEKSYKLYAQGIQRFRPTRQGEQIF